MTENETSRPWAPFENRCDRCGAESFWYFERIVITDAIQDMYFCGHHGNKHRASLEAAGFTGSDFTHLINIQASVSASV